MAGCILTVNIRDKNGSEGRVSIRPTNPANGTLANAKTLATQVAKHSDAQVVSYSATQMESMDDDCSAGTWDEVSFKGIANFVDENNKPHRITVPAPLAADFDANELYKSDMAEDWPDVIKPLLGVTRLEYRGGYLLRPKRPKNISLAQTGM